MTDLVLGINAIHKDAKFRIINNDYKTIVWADERPQPTESEIQAKIAELQAEYDANQYQRDRQSEYPSIQDQLDMQYWDKVNGTNTWQEAIASVKANHPKPE